MTVQVETGDEAALEALQDEIDRELGFPKDDIQVGPGIHAPARRWHHFRDIVEAEGMRVMKRDEQTDHSKGKLPAETRGRLVADEVAALPEVKP